jgi:hypothetical protein
MEWKHSNIFILTYLALGHLIPTFLSVRTSECCFLKKFQSKSKSCFRKIQTRLCTERDFIESLETILGIWDGNR